MCIFCQDKYIIDIDLFVNALIILIFYFYINILLKHKLFINYVWIERFFLYYL